jgi:hypothetical protein
VGLREFVDKRGVGWKVWDVTPEGMHPTTVRELFLGDFEEGWIAFESATERRRLPKWPRDWVDLSDAELEALLEQAVPVVRRGAAETATGAFRRMAEAEALLDEVESPKPAKATAPVRTFKGPGGRHWLATVVEMGADPERKTVLRFTSTDGAVLELDEWPDDWARYTAIQMTELCRQAHPPTLGMPDSSPERRSDDQQT